MTIKYIINIGKTEANTNKDYILIKMIYKACKVCNLINIKLND